MESALLLLVFFLDKEKGSLGVVHGNRVVRGDVLVDGGVSV